MDIEKYIDDNGKVAILVSPGFGAGWSTWCGDEYAEFAMFDSGLVQMAMDKASTSAVEKYIKEKLGEDSYFYCGGWEDVEIEWLDSGTHFTIEGYDGSESLRLLADLRHIA